MNRRNVASVAALVGCVAVTVAVVIIWVSHLSLDRVAYVSELGAAGEPTARAFETALLLIVGGGSAIAWAGRDIRSSARLLCRWSPAVSLWVGCGFFLVASQVTCTQSCPLPVGPTFTWQDLVHTVSAVLAFAASCLAMLQCSFATGQRMLRRLSLTAGISVAVVAAAGGILSLARFRTDIGSMMELFATTIAIGWLIVLGLSVALVPAVSASEPSAPTPGWRAPPARRSRSRRARSTGTRVPG